MHCIIQCTSYKRCTKGPPGEASCRGPWAVGWHDDARKRREISVLFFVDVRGGQGGAMPWGGGCGAAVRDVGTFPRHFSQKHFVNITLGRD